MTKLLTLVAALVCALLLTTTASAATTTLRPAADTFVDIAAPSTNYQSAPLLKVYGVSGSDINGARALYRFDRVPASAQSVKLRVYATAASSEPLGVYEILQGCNWDSSTVTWKNRPDRKALLAQIPSVRAGWNEFTVPASSVPAAGGSVCFYVSKLGTQVVQLQALDNANPTELVVDTATVSPSPAPAPGPTPTTGFSMSPTGNDANPCTLAAPCKTIKRASSVLKPGGTLWIRGGVYSGLASGNGQRDWAAPSGTPSAPTTIKAYPGEKPIFDGGCTNSGTVCTVNNGMGQFMILNGKSWWVVDGLTIRHYNDVWGNGAVLVGGTGTSASHDLVFQNNTFTDNGFNENDHHIYPGGDTYNITIRNNRFVRAPGGGVHFYHQMTAHDYRIYNNLFINNRWGVIACDGATNIYVTNNTFYNVQPRASYSPPTATIQTRCGSQPAGNVYVRNNISYQTQGAGIQVGSGVNVVESQNVLYGGGKVNASGSALPLGSGDKTSNPLFVAAPDNLQLQAGSPAIDAGAATNAPNEDFAHGPRPLGAGYDIGAFER